MRIQIFQHFHHGALRQFFHTDAVDVELSDLAHEGAKLLGGLLGRHVFLGSGVEGAQSQGSKCQEKEGVARCRHEPVKLRDAEGRWR